MRILARLVSNFLSHVQFFSISNSENGIKIR